MNYCFYNHKYEFLTLEITEKEITNKCQGQKFCLRYPRHIGSVNLKFHRSGQPINYQNRFLLISNNEESTTTA